MYYDISKKEAAALKILNDYKKGNPLKYHVQSYVSRFADPDMSKAKDINVIFNRDSYHGIIGKLHEDFLQK